MYLKKKKIRMRNVDIYMNNFDSLSLKDILCQVCLKVSLVLLEKIIKWCHCYLPFCYNTCISMEKGVALHLNKLESDEDAVVFFPILLLEKAFN